MFNATPDDDMGRQLSEMPTRELVRQLLGNLCEMYDRLGIEETHRRLDWGPKQDKMMDWALQQL
jgi:hypothetical protein